MLHFLIVHFLQTSSLFHDLPTFFFLKNLPPHLQSPSSSPASLSIFRSLILDFSLALIASLCVSLSLATQPPFSLSLSHSDDANRELTCVCHHMLYVSHSVFSCACIYCIFSHSYLLSFLHTPHSYRRLGISLSSAFFRSIPWMPPSYTCGSKYPLQNHISFLCTLLKPSNRSVVVIIYLNSNHHRKAFPFRISDTHHIQPTVYAN